MDGKLLVGGVLATQIGQLVRGARTTMAWSQERLSVRSNVPQSVISRLERGIHSGVDFDDLERLARAMGGTFHIRLDAPFLTDRARQKDRVHAACVAYVLRRLLRGGWMAASEVEISGRFGPGWIDVLAWHPATGALLVIEVKTEIRDLGQIQRTLGWYESRATVAARRLGWSPRQVHAALILLDTGAVANALRANRALLEIEVPRRSKDLAAFIASPSVLVRPGRSLAVIDPLSRRAAWLGPSTIDGRRTPPAYLDYADFARRLAR